MPESKRKGLRQTHAWQGFFLALIWLICIQCGGSSVQDEGEQSSSERQKKGSWSSLDTWNTKELTLSDALERLRRKSSRKIELDKAVEEAMIKDQLNPLPHLVFEDVSLKQSAEWTLKACNLIPVWEKGGEGLRVKLNGSKRFYRSYNLSDVAHRIEKNFTTYPWIETEKMNLKEAYDFIPRYFLSINHFATVKALEVEDLKNGQYIMLHDQSTSLICQDMIDVLRNIRSEASNQKLNMKVQVFDLKEMPSMLKNPLFYSALMELVSELLFIDWHKKGTHFLSISPGEMLIVHEIDEVKKVKEFFECMLGKRQSLKIPKLKQSIQFFDVSSIMKPYPNHWKKSELIEDEVEDLIFLGGDLIEDLSSVLPGDWGTKDRSEKMMFEYTKQGLIIRAQDETMRRVKKGLALITGKGSTFKINENRWLGRIKETQGLKLLAEEIGTSYLEETLKLFMFGEKKTKVSFFKAPKYMGGDLLLSAEQQSFEHLSRLMHLFDGSGGLIEDEEYVIRLIIESDSAKVKELPKLDHYLKHYERVKNKDWVSKKWRVEKKHFGLFKIKKKLWLGYLDDK